MADLERMTGSAKEVRPDRPRADRAGLNERLADRTLLRQQCLIGGNWRDAERAIGVKDPATGHAIGAVPSLSVLEVLEAIAAAQSAFEGWRQTPPQERSA